MTNYEKDTYDLIPGSTPREKFDNMDFIMKLLSDVAFPGRGTEQESWTIQNVADMIIEGKLVQP